MIDLESKYLAEIKTILKARIPDYEVRAFGSRVVGNAKKYSDLDLAVVGEEKLDWRAIEDLKDDFAESDLPFMVDVLDWNAISKEFQEVIEKKYVIVRNGDA